jgi:glycosyltransferase involved in cell wall biosynthesis
MKIGILCSGSNPVPPKNYGGVQAVNYVTVEALVDYGHEVYLFAPVGSKTSGKLVTIESGWGSLVEQRNTEKFLSKYVDKLDVLIDTSAFGFPGKKWKDLPYIYRLGGDTKKIYCGNVDRNIVFPSRSHMEFHNIGDCACSKVRSELGCEPIFIYKPVCFPGNIENLPFADDKNKGYYLYIGLIQEHKGTHFAVEFAKKTGVRLRVVGPIGNEGYFKTKIQPFLNNKITYEPAVSFNEKWLIMRDAIATLFTTNCEEGGPNVPLESLLTGTPVIGFNKSTLIEIVEDGKTGLLGDTVDDMCDCISELDAIKSVDCRSSVLDKFGMDAYITSYIKLMNEVINGKEWI